MKIYQKALFTLMLPGLMIACAPTTQLQKSWADPSITKASVKPFNKVLVFVAMKDDATRRIAEDKIVAKMKPGVGIRSYSYLKSTDTDQKIVEEQLKKDGFDGIVVMRLKTVAQSSTYVPGSSYGGWYGYRYGSPGYISVDKEFIVETNIYSLAESKLLWAGTTSSLNPTSLDQTMDTIISIIRYDLKKKGLIK